MSKSKLIGVATTSASSIMLEEAISCDRASSQPVATAFKEQHRYLDPTSNMSSITSKTGVDTCLSTEESFTDPTMEHESVDGSVGSYHCSKASATLSAESMDESKSRKSTKIILNRRARGSSGPSADIDQRWSGSFDNTFALSSTTSRSEWKSSKSTKSSLNRRARGSSGRSADIDQRWSGSFDNTLAYSSTASHSGWKSSKSSKSSLNRRTRGSNGRSTDIDQSWSGSSDNTLAFFSSASRSRWSNAKMHRPSVSSKPDMIYNTTESADTDACCKLCFESQYDPSADSLSAGNNTIAFLASTMATSMFTSSTASVGNVVTGSQGITRKILLAPTSLSSRVTQETLENTIIAVPRPPLSSPNFDGSKSLYPTTKVAKYETKVALIKTNDEEEEEGLEKMEAAQKNTEREKISIENEANSDVLKGICTENEVWAKATHAESAQGGHTTLAEEVISPDTPDLAPEAPLRANTPDEETRRKETQYSRSNSSNNRSSRSPSLFTKLKSKHGFFECNELDEASADGSLSFGDQGVEDQNENEHAYRPVRSSPTKGRTSSNAKTDISAFSPEHGTKKVDTVPRGESTKSNDIDSTNSSQVEATNELDQDAELNIQGVENRSENEPACQSVHSLPTMERATRSSEVAARAHVSTPTEGETEKSGLPHIESAKSNDTDTTKSLDTTSSVTVGSNGQVEAKKEMDHEAEFNFEIVDDTERVHIGFYESRATEDDCMKAAIPRVTSTKSNNTDSTKDVTVGSWSNNVDNTNDVTVGSISLEVESKDGFLDDDASLKIVVNEAASKTPKEEGAGSGDAVGGIIESLFACGGAPPFQCNTNNHVGGHSAEADENTMLLCEDGVDEAENVEIFFTRIGSPRLQVAPMSEPLGQGNDEDASKSTTDNNECTSTGKQKNVTVDASTLLNQKQHPPPQPAEEVNSNKVNNASRNQSTTNMSSKVDKDLQQTLKRVLEPPDVPGFEIIFENHQNDAIVIRELDVGKRRNSIGRKLTERWLGKGQQKQSDKGENGFANCWKDPLDHTVNQPNYCNRKNEEVSWAKPPSGFDERRTGDRRKAVGKASEDTEELMVSLLAKNKKQKIMWFKRPKEKSANGKRIVKPEREKAEEENQNVEKEAVEEKIENEVAVAKAEASDNVGDDFASSKYWRATLDATTGELYYYNEETKAVAWIKPSDTGQRLDTEDKGDPGEVVGLLLAKRKQNNKWFKPPKGNEAKEKRTENLVEEKTKEEKSSAAEKKHVVKKNTANAKTDVNDDAGEDSAKYWKPTLDATTGELYYYNKKTKAVAWTRPPSVDNTNNKGNTKGATGWLLVKKKQRKTWFKQHKVKMVRDKRMAKVLEHRAEKENIRRGKAIAEEKNLTTDTKTAHARAEINGNENSAKYWRATWDANTGEMYYYNKKTKKVTWTKPPGYGQRIEGLPLP